MWKWVIFLMGRWNLNFGFCHQCMTMWILACSGKDFKCYCGLRGPTQMQVHSPSAFNHEVPVHTSSKRNHIGANSIRLFTVFHTCFYYWSAPRAFLQMFKRIQLSTGAFIVMPSVANSIIFIILCETMNNTYRFRYVVFINWNRNIMLCTVHGLC